ncbi:unnamed protein product [Ilex paraguariensis]|uniref:Uncharacterized protein n=1 Tax=Ilex paraguariensis TaxID=185542 RepID=A0ABC8R418_9AQUA
MLMIAAASSISFGPSHCHYCHAEGVGCSTSYGVTSRWIGSSFDCQRITDHSGISFRCGNPFFGATRSQWLQLGDEMSLSKVFVAADYSDSVPDSSNYLGHNGYHPLEELKDRKRVRDINLTSAEIARTAVEANNSAWLIFPSMVHCEPHRQISWAEFQYVIDEWGECFIWDGYPTI